MAVSGFDGVLTSLYSLFSGSAAVWLNGFLLLLVRTIAFVTQAPVLGRKDIPTLPKVALAVFLTLALLPLVPRDAMATGILTGMHTTQFFILVMVNIVVGATVAFVPRLILETISAAGSFANNQIGLSAANVFDPGTRMQNSLLGPLFNFIGLLIYIQIGGVDLLIYALRRSTEVFPLHVATPELFRHLTPDFLVYISGNVLAMGLQIVGPVFVVTMVMDIMLGIVNRTAQQIPVFQLSFATKPVVGLLVMMVLLMPMLTTIRYYLMEAARFL